LSAEQVRHDTSVIARTMINGYCGWPFHSEIVKRTILNGLEKIYDGARNMTVLELFNKLKPIVEKIPDNHIRIILGDNSARTTLSHKNKDVGRNLAAWNERLKITEENGITILAIRTLSNWSDEHYDKIKSLEKNLGKSKCLIVDLRQNGGGSSRPVDWLADFLYGAETRGAVKTYIRATPEARIIQSANPNNAWARVDKSKDPAVWADYTSISYPKFASDKPGYAKPIYILTDGNTGSSAEIFVLCMTKHPYVKYVGDNTAGMEVYGYMGCIATPNSQIKLAIGNVYRELEIENFELNGFTPTIKCKNSQDALAVALTDFEESKKIQLFKNRL
jgi:C-terminal processing protease CtpA/Prc